MSKDNLNQYDSTAGNNTDVGGVDVDEGMAPSGVNNAIREVMSHLADFVSTQDGGLQTGGSSNAYTLTSGCSFASLSEITFLVVRANHANTGAATLAVDGLTAKSIVKTDSTALASGEITSGDVMLLSYNATNDEFQLHNPTELAEVEDPPVDQTTGNLAPHTNLVVTNNGSNPTYQVDIDADRVTLTDGSGYLYEATSVNLTVDISATGANGRDVTENSGSEKSSDWYFLWVIYNGSTVSGFATLASSFPSALPSDYTYAGLVGAVRNDGSGDLVYFYQRDKKVVVNQADNQAANAQAYSSLTEVSFAAYIPDNAAMLHLYMLQSGVGGNQGDHDVAIDSSGNGTLTFQTHNTVGGRTAHSDWLVLKTTSLWFERGTNNPDLTLEVMGWAYS